MLKLPSIFAVSATLAIAGCGGGGGDEASSSPLDEALRYLPADTPFVAAIDTDTDGEQYKAVGEIAERFGLGDRLVDQIEEQLGAGPGEIDRLEKALGNEFVVGSTDVRELVDESGGDDESFVGAIQASSPDALDSLLSEQDVEERGESGGAKIYKDDDGDEFAVKDDVLIVAGNRRVLDGALETREGDDSLTEEKFEAGLDELPPEALIRVYVDVAALLHASPEAKDALKVKWVDALRTGGLTVAFKGQEVAVDFKIETESSGLTAKDVPIVDSAQTLGTLDGFGDVKATLQNPAHLLAFVQSTAKTVDPEGFSGFEAAKTQIERATGIDLEDDVLGAMRGELAVKADLDGKFGARVKLDDPAAFEQTLAKLADVVPDFAAGIAGGEKVGFARPKRGEDFYAVATSGGDKVVYGVVGDYFVLSNDAAVAGSLATDGETAYPGSAPGSLTFRIDAEEVARSFAGELPGTGVDLLDRARGAVATRPLDELNGILRATTEYFRGSLRLTLD